MKFTFQTVTLAAIASFSLLAAPFVITQSAQAGGGRGGHPLEQLDLSDAQQAEIETIRTDARSQMRSVLTTEQQALLDNSESEGRRAWRQLDLSDAQREELRSIRETTREEVQSVLTTEQQAQLEEMREQRGRGGRGERRGGQESE